MAAVPTVSQKLVGFASERVTAFSPESWPVSNRNGDRDHPGMVAGIERIPQHGTPGGVRHFCAEGARSPGTSA